MKKNSEIGYSNTPILASIPATDFVDKWLSLEKRMWGEVQNVLITRYSSGRLYHDLIAEQDWAVEVVKELKNRASQNDGYKSLRILRVIPQTMQELANDQETNPNEA